MDGSYDFTPNRTVDWFVICNSWLVKFAYVNVNLILRFLFESRIVERNFSKGRGNRRTAITNFEKFHVQRTSITIKLRSCSERIYQ